MLKNGADKFAKNKDGYMPTDFCHKHLPESFTAFIEDASKLNPFQRQITSCREFSLETQFATPIRDFILENYLVFHRNSKERLDKLLDFFMLKDKPSVSAELMRDSAIDRLTR